jgi:hypothetical protein
MKKLLALSTLSVALSGSLYANEYSDLEEKINALIEEVDSLKSAKTDSKLASYYGAGNAASRVYYSDEKLSVGGYGHTDFVGKQGRSGDTLDNYRAILYVGYSFTDKIKFQSEIEFEHVDELAVEFAAVDFIVNDNLNFRTGHFIVPVGHINLQHEPTLFLNVTRPDTEKRIVPATWHENGAMVYGQIGSNVEYQVAMIASLDANNDANVRDMRSGGSKSAADDFAYAARLTYKPMDGLQFIASGFYGEVAQGNSALDGASVTIVEAHMLYNANNVRLTAFYAQTMTNEADKIALANTADAASKTNGYYVTLGYDISKFTPFIHVESYDQFAKGFDGTTGLAETNDKKTDVLGFGVNYWPHEQVVLKADYMDHTTAGAVDSRLSLGLGYIF